MTRGRRRGWRRGARTRCTTCGWRSAGAQRAADLRTGAAGRTTSLELDAAPEAVRGDRSDSVRDLEVIDDLLGTQPPGPVRDRELAAVRTALAATSRSLGPRWLASPGHERLVADLAAVRRLGWTTHGGDLKPLARRAASEGEQAASSAESVTTRRRCIGRGRRRSAPGTPRRWWASRSGHVASKRVPRGSASTTTVTSRPRRLLGRSR